MSYTNGNGEFQTKIVIFSDSSTTGYTLAVIFIIAGIFIVIGVFVYNRRKKPNSLAQQLEIIVKKIVMFQNKI